MGLSQPRRPLLNQGKMAKAEAIRPLQSPGQDGRGRDDVPTGHCKERRRHGDQTTSTLDTVDNLGLLYYDQGKMDEAEAMYQRALQGKGEGMSPSHTSTLDTVGGDLAVLFSDQGRMDEAETMYQRALQGYEKAWGPDHISTLSTVDGNLAVCSDQGRMGSRGDVPTGTARIRGRL
ncbi:kinesin light chain [Apiospora marii]|uniref:kinesin light chain n=1 Tax=Apiospora marii TaxID=335849 RepID=UPI00312F6622